MFTTSLLLFSPSAVSCDIIDASSRNVKVKYYMANRKHNTSHTVPKNTIVIFTCPEGMHFRQKHERLSAVTSVCQDSGSWDSDIPTCEVPSTSSNGK